MRDFGQLDPVISMISTKKHHDNDDTANCFDKVIKSDDDMMMMRATLEEVVGHLLRHGVVEGLGHLSKV